MEQVVLEIKNLSKVYESKGAGVKALTDVSLTVNQGETIGIVGGLIIGDIAVSLNWASVDVLFYAAVTLLSSLAIADVEFSDAIRLYRILLLLATGLFRLPGFLVSLALTLLSIATTPTFGGFSYFWPLVPFNRKALGRLLFRSPTPKAQPSTIWNRGKLHDSD